MADDLASRLQRLREGNAAPAAPAARVASEDSHIFNDVVTISPGNVQVTSDEELVSEEGEEIGASYWRDEKEAQQKSYFDSSHRTLQNFKHKSMRRAPSMINDEPTYESAFRVVQQAIEAEQTGDPQLAIDLYVDAGEILIKVGTEEQDPLLREGMQKKAYEMLQRAEQLDEWMKNVTAQAQQEAIPVAKIQRTEVPTVEKSWNGRNPPYHDAPEYRNMRYTAVATSDPIRFTEEGYALRCYEQNRSIKVFITVTMYNEDGEELKGTLTGIAKNLDYMCEKHGINYWEHVAIAVVSDGRTKASASCKEFLTQLGAFDEELMHVTSLGVDVHLHMFETSIQFPKQANFASYYPPLQLIFALKEHNGGKLNSHLWFFNAFAEQLLPTYTLLIDVGTIPGPDSIYRLVRSMERNRQIGGVTGEIAVDKPNFGSFVVSSQHFEYKISNIMDKSLESVWGFISVLPGAFSGYRYEAIRAEKGVGPLAEYLKSLTTSTKELGPFKGNMYLAEDRILCFELLARKNRNWTMHYVKNAIARTDVPMTLVNLIKQRRRWLNGSFFAGLFAIANFHRVWTQSSHGVLRKFVLTFQFLYLSIQNLLSWFLLSNLFLTFYYVLTLALYQYSEIAVSVILAIYLGLVGGIIVFALGNKPDKRTGKFYSICSLYFGMIMAVVTALSIYGLVADVSIEDPREDLSSCSTTDSEVRFGVVAALGFIFLSAVIHGEFGVFLSTIQYYCMLPTYVNILGVFAYSNLHDLSWGTKGLESGGGHGTPKPGKGNVKDVVEQQKRAEEARRKAQAEKDDVENSFRAFRSLLLMFWLLSNGIWLYAMTNYVSSSCYLKYLSFVVAGFNIIRFVGALVFILFRLVRGCGVDCSRKASSKSTYTEALPPDWQTHFARQHREHQQRNVPSYDQLATPQHAV